MEIRILYAEEVELDFVPKSGFPDFV